ncbi:uncharacterized protein BX664DRAFT_120479 [Halteromyces radiatus]|uniref:uncharacterized protein n=1 Tax=Halteromyces radiatus TaxID=101107 RepID=UPI00221E5309|nr:uncharacterized protein BX664DRAFT_120479 [Halteromyces radiatus]KAI8088766.1 hypothetical protein BX664DRAFT_120479 [Halteromyces radiatus]
MYLVLEQYFSPVSSYDCTFFLIYFILFDFIYLFYQPLCGLDKPILLTPFHRVLYIHLYFCHAIMFDFSLTQNKKKIILCISYHYSHPSMH